MDADEGHHECNARKVACYDILSCTTEQGGPCNVNNACTSGAVYSYSSETFWDEYETGDECGPIG